MGGLALAWLGIHELLVIAPEDLPRLDTIRIGSVVLAFTVVAGLVAAAIFGLASAWRAARPDVMNVLRGTSRNEGLASGGPLRMLVGVGGGAPPFVLPFGTGLMFRRLLGLHPLVPLF